MRRFKVTFFKYGVYDMKSFNERAEAIEFAIGKILDNWQTKVIDNMTGKEIKI